MIDLAAFTAEEIELVKAKILPATIQLLDLLSSILLQYVLGKTTSGAY
jgi:hypothetical protein